METRSREKITILEERHHDILRRAAHTLAVHSDVERVIMRLHTLTEVLLGELEEQEDVASKLVVLGDMAFEHVCELKQMFRDFTDLEESGAGK